MRNETDDIVLWQGLEGHDFNIDLLMTLWEDIQASSAEAAQAPAPDLFSFAQNAFYFAVIMKKSNQGAKKKDAPTQNTGTFLALVCIGAVQVL
jgi:hypothetical protein